MDCVSRAQFLKHLSIIKKNVLCQFCKQRVLEPQTGDCGHNACSTCWSNNKTRCKICGKLCGTTLKPNCRLSLHSSNVSNLITLINTNLNIEVIPDAIAEEDISVSNPSFFPETKYNNIRTYERTKEHVSKPYEEIGSPDETVDATIRINDKVERWLDSAEQNADSNAQFNIINYNVIEPNSMGTEISNKTGLCIRTDSEKTENKFFKTSKSRSQSLTKDGKKAKSSSLVSANIVNVDLGTGKSKDLFTLPSANSKKTLPDEELITMENPLIEIDDSKDEFNREQNFKDGIEIPQEVLNDPLTSCVGNNGSIICIKPSIQENFDNQSKQLFSEPARPLQDITNITKHCTETENDKSETLLINIDYKTRTKHPFCYHGSLDKIGENLPFEIKGNCQPDELTITEDGVHFRINDATVSFSFGKFKNSSARRTSSKNFDTSQNIEPGTSFFKPNTRTKVSKSDDNKKNAGNISYIPFDESNKRERDESEMTVEENFDIQPKRIRCSPDLISENIVVNFESQAPSENKSPINIECSQMSRRSPGPSMNSHMIREEDFCLVVGETPQKDKPIKVIMKSEKSRSSSATDQLSLNSPNTQVDPKMNEKKELHNMSSCKKFASDVKHRSTPVHKSSKKCLLYNYPKTTSIPDIYEEVEISYGTEVNASAGIMKDLTSEKEFIADLFPSPKTTINNKPTISERDICLSCSGLDPKIKLQVKSLTQKMKWNFCEEFTKDVTHLIVRVDQNGCTNRTLKYIQALSFKCWIVKLEWIIRCAHGNKHIPEDEYLALDVTGRKWPEMIKKSSNSLFQGVVFYCSEPYKLIPIDILREIIENLGGTVTDNIEDVYVRDPKRVSLFVVQISDTQDNHTNDLYSKSLVVPVNVEWVVDCIGNGECSNIGEWLMTNESLLPKIDWPEEFTPIQLSM